jgi:hypothetical protein
MAVIASTVELIVGGGFWLVVFHAVATASAAGTRTATFHGRAMLAGEVQLPLLAEEGELLLEVVRVIERGSVLCLPASRSGRTPPVTTAFPLAAPRMNADADGS